MGGQTEGKCWIVLIEKGENGEIVDDFGGGREEGLYNLGNHAGNINTTPLLTFFVAVIDISIFFLSFLYMNKKVAEGIKTNYHSIKIT